VAWRDHVVNDEPAAPIILASDSDDIETALAHKLYTLTPLEDRQTYLFLFDKPYYVWLRPQVKLGGFEDRQTYLFLFDKPYYVWLRPQVKLGGFVRKDLWAAMIDKSAPEVPAQEENGK